VEKLLHNLEEKLGLEDSIIYKANQYQKKQEENMKRDPIRSIIVNYLKR
jgi:hypothetical protein